MPDESKFRVTHTNGVPVGEVIARDFDDALRKVAVGEWSHRSRGTRLWINPGEPVSELRLIFTRLHSPTTQKANREAG